jgi:hypothetical protein
MAKKTSKKSAKVAKEAAAKRVAAKPTLLAGGNPQIAKADGDAPVQAYIATMPGWKRDVGRRLDALIVRTVPDVRKAVKWNSSFYYGAISLCKCSDEQHDYGRRLLLHHHSRMARV